MEFLVTGRDGVDGGAAERRARARERHLAGITKLSSEGRVRFGVSILDGEGAMAGSVLICDFENRQALDAWLREEPYVTDGVWVSVTVEPCAIGPMFRAKS
jgi:uncharacterized protein YciI